VSARVWTRAELDRVHPLPGGWEWSVCRDGSAAAIYFRGGIIQVDDDGDLVGRDTEYLPSAVCLAVILASQGLDSREAMAAEFDRRAKDNRARAERAFTASMEIRQEGMADALDEAASMLRRGTVPS
jgi:hypothetical protein